MKVTMRIPRQWQDAGYEQQLDAGQVYDLPDVIAAAFIATGAAERAEFASDRGEERQMRPPETKPARPRETK